MGPNGSPARYKATPCCTRRSVKLRFRSMLASSSPTRPIENPEASLRQGPFGGSIDTVVATTVRLSQVAPPDPSKVKEGYRNQGGGYATWEVTRSFVDNSRFVLRDRTPGFGSDKEVWEQVVGDPSACIVDGGFLSPGGGPQPQVVQVGDLLKVSNPQTGQVAECRIVGVLKAQGMMRGLYLGPSLFAALFQASPPNMMLIKATPGADKGALATELNGAYIHNGLQARVFREYVEADMRVNTQFIRLMQGYLGLGLVVGIAGLGVLMVRAVRERRREIGMLSALGISSKVVSKAFIAESSFIALEGILSGSALGLVTSYNMFKNTIGQQVTTLRFDVPVTEVLVLCSVALGAAILFTLWPARNASQITPAVALRIAD